MKTFLQNPKRILAVAGLAGVCGLFGTASAQTHQARVYADFQGTSETGVNLGLVALTGTVSNPANATSASIRDSSTLSYTLSALGLIGAGQFLEFTTDGTTPKTITAGTPIYVKVKLPTSLLGVLDNLTIGTFTNLHTVAGSLTQQAGYDATKTPVITSANIANLLNGAGTVEFKVVPTTDANGVYVQLSSVLGTVSSANVFHAYILEDQAGDAGCPTPIDWLNGTNASLSLDLASATGTTVNPQAAIDNDDNTAATFSTGVQAASLPYYTALLNTPAKSGDSVRVVLDNPNGGLLNVGLLTSFSIQAYNDNTAVGAPIVNDPALLKVALLPGATNKNVITAAVPGDFNRIQITMGGVADLSSLLGNGTLNIYEIGVKVPAPHSASGATNSDQYAYTGNAVTLAATANANGDGIVWSSNADGTGAISSPVSGLTDGVYTYYARSSRNGCTSASGVDTLNVHVVTPSNPALPSGNIGTPYSQLVTLDAPATTLPATAGYKFTYVTSTFNPVVLGSSTSSIMNRYAMADIPATFASGPMNMAAQMLFAPSDLTNGLSYNDATNTIEGTPTTEGTYHVTFSVQDTANNLAVGQITKDITIAAALPVTLNDFNVHLDNNKNAVLTWVTESEQGSIRFDVLHSSDGTNFSTIGSVAAAGTSTTTRNYSFTDNNPGAKSYYKLSIVKTDGIKTSDVVSISGGRVAGFSINPNPASNDITISGISADNIKSVSIYDAGGRLVQKATNNHISVRNLSQGVYFVTVVTNDGNKTNGKFIKK